MPDRKSYQISCDGCNVEQWRKEADDWRPECVDIKDLDKNAQLSTQVYCMNRAISDSVIQKADIHLSFAQAGLIRDCSDCRQHFSQVFNIPDCFWTDYCKRSNGYFGCENKYKKEELECHNTWFRFLVKQTLQHPANGKEYVWYKLNIFTIWLPGGKCTTISFETPEFLKPRILALVQQNQLSKYDPYWVHTVLVGEVVVLQDQAVWSVRNFVRTIELGRTLSSRPNPQYPRLHDIARHAIHVSETLDVAIITIESILMQHEQLFLEEATMKTSNYTNQTRRKMYFHQHMMKSLRGRAQANKERLLNEITLAFNTVAQYDSRIAVQIGQAAQTDSAAMKTIAFLTLAFLPATFISAIFSMSFFNFTPGTDGAPNKWSISEKFWVYWAVAIPLSAGTVALWLFWHRFFPPKIIGE